MFCVRITGAALGIHTPIAGQEMRQTGRVFRVSIDGHDPGFDNASPHCALEKADLRQEERSVAENSDSAADRARRFKSQVLDKPRPQCDGWIQNTPGLSPAQHWEAHFMLSLEKIRQQQQADHAALMVKLDADRTARELAQEKIEEQRHGHQTRTDRWMLWLTVITLVVAVVPLIRDCSSPPPAPVPTPPASGTPAAQRSADLRGVRATSRRGDVRSVRAGPSDQAHKRRSPP